MGGAIWWSPWMRRAAPSGARLRNLLKGMVRSGELHQDHRGAYHAAKAGGPVAA